MSRKAALKTLRPELGKYKKCCLKLQRDAPAPSASLRAPDSPAAPLVDELDQLDRLSNRVVDLVDAGRLDDAQEQCQELLDRGPDQPDGLERLAEVHEARGDNASALATYRELEAFVSTTKTFQPAPDYLQWLRGKISELSAA